MTDQATRYDSIARGYARWWAPVLAPTAVGVLDGIETIVTAGARQILDVGTGTATLAIAAIERWPHVKVTGVDASSGMAAAARAEADRRLGPADRRRFEVRVAFADRMPFDDSSFDAAVSSFVLQLVPSRAAVLREAHRVLRPDSGLAHVTWLAASRAFQPDIEFDAALEEIGEGAREPDGRSGDYRSVGTAAAELRRAGFRGVRAEERELVHRFEPDEYEKFLEEFDEEDLFSSLEPHLRDRLKRELRRRLGRLPADAFRLRLPVVIASGRRS
ncbi:MAG: class I SAM-dependent methyltransferase [Chloroflexota bacterium]|nr:class I SAM-dependent methyltransferase [Chloroflexota bacterium]